MKLFVTWLAVSFVHFVSDAAILSFLSLANCGDQAVLTCTSTDCKIGYRFRRGDVSIYSSDGPQPGTDQARYSANVTSTTVVLLTIINIHLSDAGAYKCNCGFDTFSAVQTLRYECKASMSSANVTSVKKLQITVDKLYPQPSNILTYLNSSTSELPGTNECVPSSTLTSHFTCTWMSTASQPDSNHSYTITVTTGTQTASVTGSFRIVTPTSPTISNLSTISNNRQIVQGVQDTPLTIECVSQGGIPAPTLAWYRGNTSTSTLAQSTTSDYVQQSDGTYRVTVIHRFTPSRRDDMTKFLCRVFYPGATTEASADPSPASADLYLDLKPDIKLVSQTGEAISGGNMTLRCTSVNGRPAPSITWSYGGKTYTPTNSSSPDPISATYTTVSVLQRPVGAVDNGQAAVCMVLHTTLSAPLNGTVTVDVKFGPSNDSTNITGNQATQAAESNRIRLNCTSSSSNPASNITWHNGSEVIQNTENYTRWSGNNKGVITSNILTITPTRYMDGDRITCRTDNGYGSYSKSVDLDVHYSTLLEQLPNVTAIEGEPDVTLTCSVSSKPPANFTWYKGSMVLASGIGSLTSNKFSYVIPRVDRTYAGSYQCHASNNVGSPDSKDTFLIVNYPPTVTVSANISLTYTVTCTAEGNPTNYMYQDWVQMWPGYGFVDTIPFNGTTLTLPNDTYERSGVYVCRVSNGIPTYDTNVEYMEGNASLIIKAPPVLIYPSPGGPRVPVPGRLGQNATIEIRYWSNLNGSAVRCYKLVNGLRSSFSICSIKETNTMVVLPVYNHLVTESGMLATLTIPINSKEDLTDYDVVVTNSVPGESVLGIVFVLQDKDSPPVESQTALISGIVTGVCVLLVITVVVLIICWRRKAGGNKTTGNERRNLGNTNASSGSVVECAMYESAGHAQQRTPTDDLYSKPKKKDQAVLKAAPVKHKKELSKSAKQGDERVYEYPEATASFGPFMPKKKINKDGLVYADLEFNNSPNKSTIHGLDNATTYVQVDFTKVADPMPDSDEETYPE